MEHVDWKKVALHVEKALVFQENEQQRILSE
jgi:hypothetical protein